jgi:DNA mismatch repair ATPase MutL
MEKQEKNYTPQEVALAIADKIKSMCKTSNLYKTNTAHEIEPGKEANTEDAECPESLLPTEKSKTPEKHKRDGEGSSEKSTENSEPKKDSEEDEEYDKEYKNYDDGKEDDFVPPKEDNEEDKDKVEKSEKSLKLQKFLNKKLEKSDPSLKPPKDWWEQHVAAIKRKKPGYSEKRISRILGGKWYHEMSRKAKSKVRVAEGKKLGSAPTQKCEVKSEEIEKFLGTDKIPQQKPIGQGSKVPQSKVPKV